MGPSGVTAYFLAAGFLAALGLAAGFLAAGFLAAGFLAAGFLAAGFMAALGLAALVAVFVGVLGFLAAAGFLAAGFFVAFLGVFLVAGFLTAFLGVFFSAGFLAAGFLAAGFLATFSFLGFSTLPILKDPEAPVPLVWTIFPDSTADLRKRLMNGASLATSILLLAAMYFLIAGREDPFLSLRAVMASATMVATGGWVGTTLGLVVFLVVVVAVAADMMCRRRGV